MILIRALPLALLLTVAPGALAGPYQNALLWTQASREHEACLRSLYRLATLRLDQALADSAWSALGQRDAARLPPAVVLDLDETVLDNSPFAAWLERQGRVYDEPAESDWERWVARGGAEALPGAGEFLAAAGERGVQVCYVSDRQEGEREATLRNLEALGLPAWSAPLWLAPSGGAVPDKAARRAEVAATRRVLLLVGDSAADFPPAAADDPRWGREWILLPNPVYGGWEGDGSGLRPWDGR
jgi:5'-nucleotidase (lipoprotein e(P4) family)